MFCCCKQTASASEPEAQASEVHNAVAPPRASERSTELAPVVQGVNADPNDVAPVVVSAQPAAEEPPPRAERRSSSDRTRPPSWSEAPPRLSEQSDPAGRPPSASEAPRRSSTAQRDAAFFARLKAEAQEKKLEVRPLRERARASASGGAPRSP